MTPEEIDRLMTHLAGGDEPLPDALAQHGADLREVAEWLDLADPAELVEATPPADLLERIHDATGPAPARSKRRLAPSFLGRYTPAVAAAALIVAIALASLWPRGGDDFIEFELASQNGEPVTAEFRFESDGATTTFDVRASGLEKVRYDVWVRTAADGERHWIGFFEGDIDGTATYVADFSPEEIGRFWVTDPADEPVLGHDID